MRMLLTTLLLQLLVWAAAAHTQNYDIVVKAAAAKKNAPALEVGKTYLLIEKQGFHHKIVVGTVTENNGERDFDATMTQLVKDPNQLSGQSLADYCSLIGNPCDTQPIDAYKCGVSTTPQKYKFVSQAVQEFAEPEVFKATGNMLVQRTGGYNIVWHNCQTFARNMANVGSVPQRRRRQLRG